MTNFDELFNINDAIDPYPKMTKDEFIVKAIGFLKAIESEYGKSWSSRMLPDEERDIAPCDICKAEGSFELNGRTINCVSDRESGDCYERVFDVESFSAFIETQMFEKDEFYGLLNTEFNED